MEKRDGEDGGIRWREKGTEIGEGKCEGKGGEKRGREKGEGKWGGKRGREKGEGRGGGKGEERGKSKNLTARATFSIYFSCLKVTIAVTKFH